MMDSLFRLIRFLFFSGWQKYDFSVIDNDILCMFAA